MLQNLNKNHRLTFLRNALQPISTFSPKCAHFSLKHITILIKIINASLSSFRFLNPRYPQFASATIKHSFPIAPRRADTNLQSDSAFPNIFIFYIPRESAFLCLRCALYNFFGVVFKNAKHSVYRYILGKPKKFYGRDFFNFRANIPNRHIERLVFFPRQEISILPHILQCLGRCFPGSRLHRVCAFF